MHDSWRLLRPIHSIIRNQGYSSCGLLRVRRLSSSASNSTTMTERDSVDLLNRLIHVRRDIHQHPELGMQEFRTVGKISEFLDGLKQYGLQYRTVAGGCGVIAEIIGAKSKPFVCVRSDIDALPIKEETGLEFASQNPGVMHACGHDVHTVIGLGAAETLAREHSTTPLPVSVRFIFQPAEETSKGALAMIRDGCLTDAQCIFGLHVDRRFDVGQMIVHQGCVNASTDTFRIEITGRGGHGARPHECVDAIIVASTVVMQLQTIVSRQINPAIPSILTIGKLNAGQSYNAIAKTAVMEGTIRAVDPITRQNLKDSIQTMVEMVAMGHNATGTTEFYDGVPPVINSDSYHSMVREATIEALGENSAMSLPIANLGGEDFSFYLEQIPGFYARLGCAKPNEPNISAHSSKFDVNEDAIGVGLKFMVSVVRKAMQKTIDDKVQ